MGAADRYSSEALTRFAVKLLQTAGVDDVPAEAVARTLVEGDLLGHDTHGLALLAPYVKEIENGTTDFLRQADWLGDACRSNPPRPGYDAVRMPGDRALSRRKEQLCDCIMLHPTIPPMLAECAQRYGMQFPAPLEN